MEPLPRLGVMVKNSPPALVSMGTNAGGIFLFKFLFQIPEQLRVEEFFDCDPKAIT